MRLAAVLFYTALAAGVIWFGFALKPQPRPAPDVRVHECWGHPQWQKDLDAVCATSKEPHVREACANWKRIYARCAS